MRTLVLGAGNELRGDDGAGVHVVRALAALPGPRGPVEYVVAGLRSVDELLLRAGRIDRLVLVDAARLGEPPGSVRVLRAEDFLERGAGTLHGLGPLEAVRLLEALGTPPREVRVVAIEPASLDPCLDLSPVLAARFAELCEAVERAARDADPPG